MTTPARIAAFLSTSALCLGLATGPAQAGQRDADGQREARSLAQEREPATGESAAATARPADVSLGRDAQRSRTR